jgi:hypothetical protein
MHGGLKKKGHARTIRSEKLRVEGEKEVRWIMGQAHHMNFWVTLPSIRSHSLECVLVELASRTRVFSHETFS